MSTFYKSEDCINGNIELVDQCTIKPKYLLAINAGLMQSKDGSYWTDRSWYKDLMKHAEYIENLTFLAPIKKANPPKDYIKIPDGAMKINGYINSGSMFQSYFSLPALLCKLILEIRKTEIVHTCIAGYPFPVGWLAVPIARLFNKKIVLIVESSFWRITSGQIATPKQKLISTIWESLNRYCLRQADYAAYPHEQYRQSLPSPRAGGGVLFQASWIDANQIVSARDVDSMWISRNSTARDVSFLFAARMVPEKGTRVLYDAVRYIEKLGLNIKFDFIGVGPELEIFKKLANTQWGRDHVRILDPIPYGREFFAFIREYDAVLSPSLSDEQPRIVYDAYAGGIPSIATNMPGLAACIKDGVTGKLVPPGDMMALADAIISAAANPATLADWGKAGRNAATQFTHDQMHIDRCRDLNKILIK